MKSIVDCIYFSLNPTMFYTLLNEEWGTLFVLASSYVLGVKESEGSGVSGGTIWVESMR